MHIPLNLIRPCHDQAKDKLRRDMHVLRGRVGVDDNTFTGRNANVKQEMSNVHFRSDFDIR
jgi:hypothetical protein